MAEIADPDEGDHDDGDPWWCWECHGQGGWEESMEENSEGPCEVECPCCNGGGEHYGADAPPCAVVRRTSSEKT